METLPPIIDNHDKLKEVLGEELVKISDERIEELLFLPEFHLTLLCKRLPEEIKNMTAGLIKVFGQLSDRQAIYACDTLGKNLVKIHPAKLAALEKKSEADTERLLHATGENILKMTKRAINRFPELRVIENTQ